MSAVRFGISEAMRSPGSASRVVRSSSSARTMRPERDERGLVGTIPQPNHEQRAYSTGVASAGPSSGIVACTHRS